MGVSEALYIPAGLSLIADYHKGTTRSLAIGIHITGLYMGQALGGFGATVAQIWSWQLTFHLFGLVGIIYSLVLMLLLRENRESAPQNNSMNFKTWLNSIKHSMGMLLGTLSFWIILFYFATPSFPGWAVKNWVPTLFAENLKIDMAVSGPLSTIIIAASSFVGVIFGGILSDRWIVKNLRGRIYTGAIGLGLTIPALFLLGLGHGFFSVITGAVMFGFGFGMFDSNNMPILCQFVSSRHRAAGYGLMNMIGVFGGAMVTKLLGKSTDAGNLGRDMALLAIPVAIAILLQLIMLKPKVADKLED
jgi:MFS family permease